MTMGAAWQEYQSQALRQMRFAMMLALVAGLLLLAGTFRMGRAMAQELARLGVSAAR